MTTVRVSCAAAGGAARAPSTAPTVATSLRPWTFQWELFILRRCGGASVVDSPVRCVVHAVPHGWGRAGRGALTAAAFAREGGVILGITAPQSVTPGLSLRKPRAFGEPAIW